MSVSSKLKVKIKTLEMALKAIYPKVFDADNPVPLAVDIKYQIKSEFPEVSIKGIHKLLRGWTKRTKYIQAVLKPYSVRMNLDGSYSTKITSEDRQYVLNKATSGTKRKLADV